VAAGLIPALKRSDSWQMLYCRPGSDPFGSLASVLMPHLEAGQDEISRAAQLPKLRDVLERGQLCYLLRQVLAASGSRALLLFIDQFEELYTHCSAQTLRDSFLDTLLTLMGAGAVASAPGIKLVWPRLSQWLEEDREILVWRQRLGFIIQEWQQTGRDDGFLLRGSLLDEARLWLARRSNDLTPAEKEFINASINLQRRERANRTIGRFELLVDNTGSELETQHARSVGEREAERLAKDLPFLARQGTWRVQINLIPVPAAQAHSLRSRLPHLSINTVLPFLSAAAPADLIADNTDDSSRDLVAAQKLNKQTFGLLKSLQLQGASGLALELISPQLDGISDPNARLKFASILFDMMHIRGRYADAAELIRQELTLYPPNAEVHSPLLLPLKIRFIHHQMFYRPVTELWPQMADLLTCCDRTQDPESYGDILFMLGGNLGTLRGNYEEARQFLVRAIRHAQQRRDHYILARCLRKYGDFLRNRGHLQLARDALLQALRLSGHGRGIRQRIYILGCLGDLERQKQNYAAASEYLERAIELARATFIPGWLGNLHLGLAELAFDRNRFDETKILLEQAEAHYRNTHPKHWWGEIQLGLSQCRLMRAAGNREWPELAREVHSEAIAAGYSNDAALASELLNGRLRHRNALMFL